MGLILVYLQKNCKQILTNLRKIRIVIPIKKIFLSLAFLTFTGYMLGFFLYQHLFYLVFTRHYNQRKISSHVWIYRRILGESGRHYSQQYQIKLDWMLKQPTELWHILNKEDVELHGHFLRNEKSTSNKVAILAHGFRGNPLQLAHFVEFYINEMGYHVLLPIARGHSSSGGRLISFGYKEKEDYNLWIEEIISEFSSEVQIILHGVSMGGATVLLTGSNKQLPPQVKAIISDSSFSSLHGALAHQFPHSLKKVSDWILSATDRRLQNQGHFSLYDINLVKMLPTIPVPVLFVHGTNDRIIPEKMSDLLYDACSNDKKRKLLVPNAGHAFSWFTSRDLYATTLRSFIEEAVQP